ncbi:hypothetical protein [Streptomyces mirabilis]|uniref:hypothetical protein n=1 Tax=Streptomyces mirabilis TaxID=68239 RepID=UPI002E2E0F98|nr:hypothetical protein [Streptomyces mirabilis]
MEEQKEAELSVTGVWIVGAVPDREVRNLLSASVQNSSPAPVHCDDLGALAWWRRKAQASMFAPSTSSPGDWSADEAALRLGAFFDACRDDSDHAAKLRDMVMDQFPPDIGEDAEQVRAQLPAVEETLVLTGTPRHDAIERIHAWMTGLGDDAAHDADQLLDGPLRVLRHAARTGHGAAGQVRWY